MNRTDKLAYNLRDANELLGEFVSHRNNCKLKYESTGLYLDFNKLCRLIGMMTDYIGYIYGDFQEETLKELDESMEKGAQDD